MIGTLLTARVGDADLNEDSLVAEEVDVLISSDSGLSETLTLIEQGENRGVFAATLPEKFGDVPVDTKAEEAATGSVLVTGADGSKFTGEFTDLRPGGKLKFSFNWTAELDDSAVEETVVWAVTVTVNDQIVDNTSAVTQVEVKKGNN